MNDLPSKILNSSLAICCYSYRQDLPSLHFDPGIKGFQNGLFGVAAVHRPCFIIPPVQLYGCVPSGGVEQADGPAVAVAGGLEGGDNDGRAAFQGEQGGP